MEWVRCVMVLRDWHRIFVGQSICVSRLPRDQVGHGLEKVHDLFLVMNDKVNCAHRHFQTEALPAVE